MDELPPSVHSRFEARVLRGFMLRYLSQFFNAIRPVRLSFDDIMRFLDDETKIKVCHRHKDLASIQSGDLANTLSSPRAHPSGLTNALCPLSLFLM